MKDAKKKMNALAKPNRMTFTSLPLGFPALPSPRHHYFHKQNYNKHQKQN